MYDAATGERIAQNHMLKGKYGTGPQKLQYADSQDRIVATSGTCLWPGDPVGAIMVFDTNLKLLGVPFTFSLDRSVQAISQDGKFAIVSHPGSGADQYNTYPVWHIFPPYLPIISPTTTRDRHPHHAHSSPLPTDH